MAKDSSTFLFTKVKEIAHNVKELDKKWAKKIQEKFKLTDYQTVSYTHLTLPTKRIV